jgi:hypothetical protein
MVTGLPAIRRTSRRPVQSLAGRELAEQLLDIGLADATEDSVQDTGERPVSIEDVAVHCHVEHSFGCHGQLLRGQVTGFDAGIAAGPKVSAT